MHVGSTDDKLNWDIVTQFSYLLTQYGSNEDNYLSLLSNGAQLYQLVSMEWFECSLITQCIQLVETPNAAKKALNACGVLNSRSKSSLNSENQNRANDISNNSESFADLDANFEGKENGSKQKTHKSGVLLDQAYYNEYCQYINENQVIITSFPVIKSVNA